MDVAFSVQFSTRFISRLQLFTSKKVGKIFEEDTKWMSTLFHFTTILTLILRPFSVTNNSILRVKYIPSFTEHVKIESEEIEDGEVNWLSQVSTYLILVNTSFTLLSKTLILFTFYSSLTAIHHRSWGRKTRVREGRKNTSSPKTSCLIFGSEFWMDSDSNPCHS